MNNRKNTFSNNPKRGKIPRLTNCKKNDQNSAELLAIKYDQNSCTENKAKRFCQRPDLTNVHNDNRKYIEDGGGLSPLEIQARNYELKIHLEKSLNVTVQRTLNINRLKQINNKNDKIQENTVNEINFKLHEDIENNDKKSTNEVTVHNPSVYEPSDITSVNRIKNNNKESSFTTNHQMIENCDIIDSDSQLKDNNKMDPIVESFQSISGSNADCVETGSPCNILASRMDPKDFANLMQERSLKLTVAGKLVLKAAKQQEEPLVPKRMREVFDEQNDQEEVGNRKAKRARKS